jgi:2'-5' RNA ligase
MEIRLAVLLPYAVKKQAISVAKSFAKKYPSHFVVDGKPLVPHITIMKIAIRKRDEELLKRLTKEVVKRFRPMKLSVHRYKDDPAGWLDWEIKTSKQLVQLRKNLDQAFKSNGLQDTILKKSYRPHVTFVKYKNPSNAKKVVVGIKMRPITFAAKTIAMAHSNSFGQVTKVIKRFTL